MVGNRVRVQVRGRDWVQGEGFGVRGPGLSALDTVASFISRRYSGLWGGSHVLSPKRKIRSSTDTLCLVVPGRPGHPLTHSTSPVLGSRLPGPTVRPVEACRWGSEWVGGWCVRAVLGGEASGFGVALLGICWPAGYLLDRVRGGLRDRARIGLRRFRVVRVWARALWRGGLMM